MALNDGIPKNAAAITPLDATNVNFASIYCGGAGNLVVTTEGGQVVTFAVQAGTTIVQRVAKVMTATTATLLVGQWG